MSSLKLDIRSNLIASETSSISHRDSQILRLSISSVATLVSLSEYKISNLSGADIL